MADRKYNRLKKKYPYYDDSLDIEKRLDALFTKLSLKDKFKLISGRKFSFWTTKPIKRLKIPKLGMSDGPNGVSLHSGLRRATKFPCSKCASASWNRELMKEYGVVIAKEVRSVGRQVLLAPGINIDRTPLNGRTFEYFSEDPYLTKEIAIPFVDGVQSQRIAACIKHYVTNNQETNRFKVSSEVGERALNEIYLRAFKDVTIDSDPWSLMGCYNKINGIYGCEHKVLLHDYLIDQWGFSGYVVTDWWATKFMKNPENCIKAGLSLEMPKAIVYKMKRLKEAFKEGKFSIDELDFVVKRLLRVMFRVGLFDNPENIPEGKRNTVENQRLAGKIAEEGIVLLKNEGELLPLDKTKISKITVKGKMATKRMGRVLYGGSSAVVPPFELKPLTGLQNYLGENVSIIKDETNADYSILFVGLTHDKKEDCENVDRTSLELSDKQIKLILETVEINPKTIVVLISGSPLSMAQWHDKVPVIVQAWHPGMLGGEAIAKMLFGDINPSGKLPITFPRDLADSPAHKSKKTFPGNDKVYYEEGIFVGYRYFDKEDIEPLFPFGYGLSYTTFKYDNLVISSSNISSEQPLEISLEITNTGERAGAEIIQLYLKDNQSSIERPPKELKGFEKIYLEPDETKTVTFEITKEDLMFYDPKKHDWVVEEGTFTVLVGSSSRDIHLTAEFEYNN